MKKIALATARALVAAIVISAMTLGGALAPTTAMADQPAAKAGARVDLTCSTPWGELNATFEWDLKGRSVDRCPLAVATKDVACLFVQAAAVHREFGWIEFRAKMPAFQARKGIWEELTVEITVNPDGSMVGITDPWIKTPNPNPGFSFGNAGAGDGKVKWVTVGAACKG